MPSEEKTSSNESFGKRGHRTVDLDEQRRVALAEIDNAKFSYISFSCKLLVSPLTSSIPPGGFT
jgi:hypothetical protein